MKMRTPLIFSVDSIKNWDCTYKGKDGEWYPARPLSLSGINLFKRISAAWMVFTGKADVVTWRDE